MTNNQKIACVQDSKEQLIENFKCKKCSNCKKPNLDVTDWDVMLSGYKGDQIYPDMSLSKKVSLTQAQVTQISLQQLSAYADCKIGLGDGD